jgi:ABC-type Fe3+ transport system substrate-binding protein
MTPRTPRLRLWSLWVVPVVLSLLAACAPAASPAAPSAPAAQAPAGGTAAAGATQGKQLLDDLVRRASQEGELSVTIQSSWNQALAQPLADAFKKRFGLNNLNVTITNAASAEHFPVAIAETRAGTPPTYDAVQGDDAETMQLSGAGGTQPIENWELLLKEINPAVAAGKVTPDQISRGPFTARSFQFMGNVKQILYNPRLINEAELPRTHAELAEGRFKDKFAQPPWTAHWEIAPVAIDNLNRQQWLDVVRAAGRNSAAVLGEAGATQRVALGQFAFALAQDTNYRKTLQQDPQAPLAARFFDDYNEYNATYYSVRAGARHPAAAALWTLWMTTPESEAIWQPVELYAQRFGESEVDRQQAQFIRDNGAKVLGFLDNARTTELLEWYQTAEGRQYLDAMTKAIKGE